MERETGVEREWLVEQGERIAAPLRTDVEVHLESKKGVDGLLPEVSRDRQVGAVRPNLKRVFNGVQSTYFGLSPERYGGVCIGINQAIFCCWRCGK